MTFGFGKKARCLKDVEATMAFLLSFGGEQFVKSIWKHYPSAEKVVIEKIGTGESLEHVASELLRVVLTDQIERALSAEKRDQLATYLRSEDAGKEAPFPFAKLCHNYVHMLFRQQDLKKLDEDWVKDCVHDVYYAAKGMTVDERSNSRMLRAIDTLVAPPHD